MADGHSVYGDHPGHFVYLLARGAHRDVDRRAHDDHEVIQASPVAVCSCTGNFICVVFDA